ncbi:ABC transporter permease [Natronolimnohabitans sp. A-GB9]|uniref:ABC transporter permease n=1 Tax=Natronolimnohabitans sp. A-GB9 TaxID=3069757 RepID=UPI0027B5C86E|nr:ABC transporter permease [Natronolimnohabitans sp. A-GB9]MDQ2052629.1 ABC transporter permease [Natronolimnohabitans sp. A-GB9]
MNPLERLVRWLGIVRVGFSRTLVRAAHTARKRTQVSILGVAIVIALLVVVTGIGVGLATSTTVYDDDVDYWIVPESDGERSALLATDQPQFGSVHDTAAQIDDYDDVDFASPVLSEVVRVQTNDTDEYVMVVGVVDSPGLERVAGISTEPLTHGDPYYADGGYDGEWTGDAVLSGSAASNLEVDTGDDVTIAGNDSFTVAGIDDGSDAVGDMPVAVVQLGELQTVTGDAEYDQADEFVVGTNAPGIEDELEGLYPQSEVLTRGELTMSTTTESGLPLALALTAFVVAVAVGTLFVITTSGLEVVADRRQLATLSAVGISGRSQLGLVAVQTLVITGVGGLVGALAGFGGIRVVNYVATETITTGPIAMSHPLFVPYGVAAAVLVGVLSLPVLLGLTRRVSGGVP